MTAPESPEVVGARARERVALYRVAQGLPPYAEMARKRLEKDAGLFAQVAAQ